MPGELIPEPLVLAARAAWGGVLLLAPGPVLRRCGDPPGEAIRLGARALGVRHLTEAALQLRYRSDGAARVFRAVDLSHSATMALLAARRRDLRTPALISLGISGVLGALD